MKKIIKGQELKEVIKEALIEICDTVASTLGPNGNNVIIDSSDASPYITNDGVTIAKVIESDKESVNAIIELIKEASLKTYEEVGDGTSTTLVLLKSIMEYGLKEENYSPTIIKRELNKTLNKIIDKLLNMRIIPTIDDYKNIAYTSSNDEEISTITSTVFAKMGNKCAIKLDISPTNKTYYEIEKGYTLDINTTSSLYFKDNNTIILDNAYIFLIRGTLTDLNTISDILNESIERKKAIVIFVSDIDTETENQLLLLHLKHNKEIYLIKTPDYASRKEIIEDDIAILTNSTPRNIDYETISWSDKGQVQKIIITKDKVTIINENESIQKRVEEIKKQIDKETSLYEIEFLKDRYARLNIGLAIIYVGANTKTEAKEKIMRYDDALCSLEVASDGILYGEGLSYLKISYNLENNTIGDKILKEVLKAPMKCLFQNADIDYKEIEEKVIASDFNLIYNFETKSLENTNTTKIIDASKVVISALKNAVSIASLLLTTNYLVINDTEEKGNIEI